MIETIARSAQEQTPVSEAVAVTMVQISEIIRQTDAGTQEAAVSVSYLAELSEQLRASVSTFRLPDRGNEASGTFSQLTSVTEMHDGNGQTFAPALNTGLSPMETHDWNQGFAGNFPPLPEPGNSGSLVALSSRSGQYAFDNQQDFSIPASFGGQQSYMNGNQHDFGFQSQFSSQPNFGDAHFSNQGFGDQHFSNQGFGDQSFSSQPNFGSFNSQQGFDGSQQYNDQQQQGNSYNHQQDFGDMNAFGGFENLPSFNGGNGQGFGGQNQAFFPPISQIPASQSFNQSVPSAQGPSTPRQRRSTGSQEGQPSPFNQDQIPFSNNGDFGR
jgi:hypothetical protein